MAQKLKSSKTRVLFIVPRLHTNLLGWLRGLNLLNVDYRILVQTQSKLEDYSLGLPEKIDPKSNYYKFSSFNKFSLSNYFLVHKKIRQIRPTIIIFRLEMNFTSFLILLNIVFSRIPFIIYDQWPVIGISKLKKLIRFLLNTFFKSPFITPVHSYNDRWAGHCVEMDYKIKQVNFVPFAMPVFKTEKNINSQTNPQNPLRLVMIGKFQFRKNHIKVVEQLIKNTYFKKSNVKLEIIGESTTLEHKVVSNKIDKLIQSNKMKNKIHLHHNLSHQDTLKKLKKCDIFLLLSDLEPASISNIEAMSFGKPIIIKIGNGTANYLNNGLGGYILHNFDDLNKKINYLMKNAKIRNKFGINNTNSLKSISDPKASADHLLAIAKQVRCK
jgi:glycosyltransferase involved in cell wall biosynthesis